MRRIRRVLLLTTALMLPPAVGAAAPDVAVIIAKGESAAVKQQASKVVGYITTLQKAKWAQSDNGECAAAIAGLKSFAAGLPETPTDGDMTLLGMAASTLGMNIRDPSMGTGEMQQFIKDARETCPSKPTVTPSAAARRHNP